MDKVEWRFTLSAIIFENHILFIFYHLENLIAHDNST